MRISDSDNEHLKSDLGHVIEVLHSDLFGALVDIQMSYEVMVEKARRREKNIYFPRNV